MQKISNNSIRRRLKKKVLTRQHEFFAICAPGFEDVLQAEVAALPDATEVQARKGGVKFQGPIDLVYSANVFLNSASRVLLRLGRFAAGSFPMLFDQMRRVEWELWIPDGGTFSFRLGVSHSALNMRRRIIETCRSAVETRLTSFGVDTEYDAADAELVFALRLLDNRATLSFDTSGNLLYKRGYKLYSVQAPLRETLAAAILLKARYYDFDFILDPFCGSGTFLVEAARMSAGRPAGYARDFGFSKALFFRPSKLETVKTATFDSRLHSMQLLGSDISPKAVDAANNNARLADLQDKISIEQRNFSDIDYRFIARKFRRPLLVSNPPYGKRVNLTGMVDGDFIGQLTNQLRGWTVALVSPIDLTSMSTLNKETRLIVANGEVVKFSNGGIDSYLHIFSLH